MYRIMTSTEERVHSAVPPLTTAISPSLILLVFELWTTESKMCSFNFT